MKREYRLISEAPRNGEPIIGVCGGVEMMVAYDDHPIVGGWFYWDEEDDCISPERCRPQPTVWRALFDVVGGTR